MKTITKSLSPDNMDRLVLTVLSRLSPYGIPALRISIGIVFFWFGALKFFPGLSPAEGIAGRTIHAMTAGLMPAETAVVLLAIFETVIGFLLIVGRAPKSTLGLLVLHLLGTLTPFIFFPAETIAHSPFVLTMEGQYIMKNLVLISGAVAIGTSTVRNHLEDDQGNRSEHRTSRSRYVASKRTLRNRAHEIAA